MNRLENFVNKLGLIFLSVIFVCSVGCATLKTAAPRKDQPTAFDENEIEQIRIERMLMFNLKHI